MKYAVASHIFPKGTLITRVVQAEYVRSSEIVIREFDSRSEAEEFLENYIRGRIPQAESKGESKMIKITLKNGVQCVYGAQEYDDYKYDGKCFVINKDAEVIALYNMDSVISVVII